MTDDREWLIRSQELLTNVRGWLSRGQSETAMREIDDYWRAFRDRSRVGDSVMTVHGMEHKP